MEPDQSSLKHQLNNSDQDAHKKIDDDFIDVESHSSFNFAQALLWLVAVLSITATVLFWWMNNDSQTLLEERKSEKDKIVQQILSSKYVDVEKKASNFKSAVNALVKASKDRFSMEDFLSDLYSKVTKDVQLSSISITPEGALNMSGSTDSYRSVADLMIALKSWDSLSNVELNSVSYGESEDSVKAATFSISAKVSLTSVEDNTNITQTGSSEGGSNEEF